MVDKEIEPSESLENGAFNASATTMSPGRDPMLLTAADVKKADILAEQFGVEIDDLMEAAGRAAADCLDGYLGGPASAGGDILVLCGTGNNGGDGFVLARYMDEWGYKIRLAQLGELSEMRGAAARAAKRWAGGVSTIDQANIAGAAVIVDALIGTGLSRNLEREIGDLIADANETDAFRFSLDVPTGLNADTGQPMGVCFKADASITFVRRKPCHLIAPGRYLCGGADNIHVANIGMPNAVLTEVKALQAENTPTLWGPQYPITGPATHKYDRGHILVLGGKEPALGASRLAALAALRIGAGLVTLAAPAETYTIQATALTDVMVRRFDSNFGFLGMLSDSRISSAVLGPGAGVGEKTAEMVAGVVEKGRPVVIDADALTSLAGRLDLINKTGESLAVLTPHDGEFTRLFPSVDLNDGRLTAARAAANLSNAVIVLKGVATIVAAPDGRVSIATNAPAWLSVGGTGDVLAGAIAGLLGQGMPPFEAASAGVWFHSAAAMRAGKGLIASDLLAAFPQVLLN